MFVRGDALRRPGAPRSTEGESGFQKTRSAALRSGGLLLVLVARQLLARDLLFRHRGKLHHEIHNLVLEDGSAHGGDRLRILLIILPHLLLVPRKLARAVDYGTPDLLLRDGDVVSLADLGENEAQPHPALRNGAIFLASLVFGRTFVGKGAALGLEVLLYRAPDVLELVLGHRGRQSELVHRVELVEELALEPLAARRRMLLLQPSPDRLLELVE